ncbi:MAG: 16S rRNA processing protein RimM [Chitinophagia bacterium]|nr:16S rRNA processing protein RimM [Chitinophagia bacterium]
MIRVGKLVATHGLNGSLIMTHVISDSRWLKKGLALHVELLKESLIPYFVAEVKNHGHNDFLLQIEEIATVEKAKKLVGKAVYVDEEVLSRYAKSSPLLWIGFAVTDAQLGEIGTVADVLMTPNQWLAKVIYQGKEVLIPLIEQFIQQVDIRKKKISVELPEGLLEVYTQ